MAQQVNYSHYTFEQLMKLKRDKLRNISKELSIPYTGNTLKQELADHILIHFNNKPINNKSRDYIIRDNIKEKPSDTYILNELKKDHFLKVYIKDLNNRYF